jgi:type VI protein secretion system component Hcp
MADIFLNLPNMKSDVKDPAFAGAIVLHTATWGMNLPMLSPGEFGPARVNEIVVSKSVDRTSPLLLQALNAKTSMSPGKISFRAYGDPLTANVFLVIDLEGVTVRQIVAQSDSGGDIPTEQLSLVFRVAMWTYRRRNADGSYTTLSQFRWEAPLA